MIKVAQVSHWITVILSTSIALLLSGCADHPELADFSTDGCSLFPDRSLIDAKDWCECCVEHDIAYWQGDNRSPCRPQ